MVELTLDRMAQNAAAARRAGDERTADYWTERVLAESDRQARAQRHQEWRILVDNRHG